MSDDIDVRSLRRGLEGDDYSDVEDVAETQTSDLVDFVENEPSEEGDDVVYLSSDPDRESDGVHSTPLDTDNQAQALRDDLAEELEDLLATAETWVDLSNDSDAQAIYDLLADAYERLGSPLRETDDEAVDGG